MILSDFDFVLPPDRIAQEPAPERDAARLLVLDGRPGEPMDSGVAELPSLLRAGDLLVVNDTRVFPARLRGRKQSGGAIEALLLRRLPENPGLSGEQVAAEDAATWEALLGASHAPRAGAILEFGAGLRGRVLEPPGENRPAVLRLEVSGSASVDEAIEAIGETPLPPYIRRKRPGTAGPGGPSLTPEDRERYQTVYARETGSVAAPTAGLHFTPALLARLAAAGVGRCSLTLHVGLGTFAPIKGDDISGHRMQAEWFRIPEDTARRIEATRRGGGRVVAVGTTVTRALEFSARTGAAEGWCDLFITPGFGFGVVDLLLTNFHLPRSTLLVLVATFAGRERVLATYRKAVERGYRFYSYGDAMLVSRADRL